MRIPKTITIAVQNTFFDGWGVDTVSNWLQAHYSVLLAEDEKKVTEHLQLSTTHPVRELLAQYEATIVILNEVLPNASGSKSISLLEDSGYSICKGKPRGKNTVLQRSTVIGSKILGEEIADFVLPGSAGGGSCGYHVPEINTSVFAIHPSAFNAKTNKQQLLYTQHYIEEYVVRFPDRKVILAGDLNNTKDNIHRYFQSLPLNHYTTSSFPHSKLFEEMKQKKWFLLRAIMGWKAMRDLDHLYVPNSWKPVNFQALQTNSDHSALVGTFLYG